MVRSNRLSNLKPNPRVVGTNVRSSVYARHFSSPRPRYQVHSVVCSQYVESGFFSRIYIHLATRKAAISKMDGVGGKPGWAWIFILEGLATVVAGFLSFWIIQDFPDSAKFLTDAERTLVVRRLQSDDQHSAAGEKFKVMYIRQSFTDWKSYLTSEQDLSLFQAL